MKHLVKARTKPVIDDRELQERVFLAVCETVILRMTIDYVMRGMVRAGHLEAVPYVEKAKRSSKSILNRLYRARYLCGAEKLSPSSRINR